MRKEKREMKKIIALLLAFAMVFALAGCGEKEPEILGTYETRFDIHDILVEMIDGEDVFEGLAFADYIGSVELVLVSEFKEDGTYYQSVDKTSVENALEEVKAATIALCRDMVYLIFVEALAEEGVEIGSMEELESFMGMSFDEACEEIMGVNLNSYAAELFDSAITVDMLMEDTETEGNYKAENGKIYLSDGLDVDYDENCYETYTVEGNVVTIHSGVNVDSIDGLSYPFDLVKISD